MGNEDYPERHSINEIMMCVFLIMFLLIMLFFVFPWMLETYVGYETITETHIVTDKWTKEKGGFLTGSSTHFYLELDNITEKEVESYEWHQYEIGDEYIIEYECLDIYEETPTGVEK